MTPDDVQVEAALKAYHGDGAPHFDEHQRDDMRSALTAALAASPEPEVVAWRGRYQGMPWEFSRLDPTPYNIFDEIQPLYAAPTSQALRDRVAVTDEMVERSARAEYTRVCLPSVMPEHRERVLNEQWRFFEDDARRWLSASLNTGEPKQ